MNHKLVDADIYVCIIGPYRLRKKMCSISDWLFSCITAEPFGFMSLFTSKFLSNVILELNPDGRFRCWCDEKRLERRCRKPFELAAAWHQVAWALFLTKLRLFAFVPRNFEHVQQWTQKYHEKNQCVIYCMVSSSTSESFTSNTQIS